jgi:two-component system chemotaxis response regulator CheY
MMPNIMVVEDSPTMRQLITFTLKRIPGYNVVEAVDGMDAFTKLSKEPFDLILADINMPVMDGLKLVGLLRNNSRYKKTPIIMITTEGTEEDRKKALAIGATAHLSKPIQTQDLLKVVQEFLGK